MGLTREEVNPPGITFTIGFRWRGDEEYLHDCYIRAASDGGRHRFEGTSIPGVDWATRAFHITEDGSEATHLFNACSGVDEDGSVVTEPDEVFENDFLSSEDLAGMSDDVPGAQEVEEASKGEEGVFLWMRCANSDVGEDETNLKNFYINAYRDGETVLSFEEGHVI